MFFYDYTYCARSYIRENWISGSFRGHNGSTHLMEITVEAVINFFNSGHETKAKIWQHIVKFGDI